MLFHCFFDIILSDHCYTICLWTTNNYPKPAPFLRTCGKVVTKSSCWNPWPPRLACWTCFRQQWGDCLCPPAAVGQGRGNPVWEKWKQPQKVKHFCPLRLKEERGESVTVKEQTHLHHQGTRGVCRPKVYVIYAVCHVSHDTWQNTIQKKQSEVAAFLILTTSWPLERWLLHF